MRCALPYKIKPIFSDVNPQYQPKFSSHFMIDSKVIFFVGFSLEAFQWVYLFFIMEDKIYTQPNLNF